eukprot:275-Eustigmatos_ZCMA.PRE.1
MESLHACSYASVTTHNVARATRAYAFAGCAASPIGRSLLELLIAPLRPLRHTRTRQQQPRKPSFNARTIALRGQTTR